MFSTVSQSLSPSFTLDVESKLVNQSRSVLSVRGALPSPLSPVLCHGLQCSVRTAKNGYAAKNQKHEAVRTPLPPSLSPPLSPLSLSLSLRRGGPVLLCDGGGESDIPFSFWRACGRARARKAFWHFGPSHLSHFIVELSTAQKGTRRRRRSRVNEWRTDRHAGSSTGSLPLSQSQFS